MTDKIRNKTMLITGANRGIGRVILDDAIERGAKKVYAAVRDPRTVSPLIEMHGDRVVPIRLDLEEPNSIVEAAEVATDVEIVINNAGVMNMKSSLEPDAIEALQQEMNINVYGLMRVAQAFAPVLQANGGGVLVQLNSVASVRASASFATYCASKAAAYSITQGLKDLLGEQGTRVISVHPGPTQTDMGCAAGFGDFASSPSLVSNSIFDAINDGQFHSWVGPLAELVRQPYQPFSDNVIEGDMKALRERAFENESTTAHSIENLSR
ncbi:SDR family oxidoreductase [Rhodopirellula bahusiensis]|uniref:Short-chain dehydrogenase n=1 Tax=Rhodopirellula bahusiensis TaxID=2014065 RepID=A0A2G1W6W6_9BACT|nr:SDR family oxidoreductase [Rhodopirellula bahusiensis]PHQ34756.1 short-chain dehydrogenase [Rhodopirellula bahusiensis]